MNQEIKEQMREAGVNIEGALERLMNNEGLYERLLGKFKADKNYQGLVDNCSCVRSISSKYVSSSIKKGIGSTCTPYSFA